MLSVMIVDGNDSLRVMLAREMCSIGEIRVVTGAGDGEAALGKLGQMREEGRCPPADVLLLEVDLPSVSGPVIVRRVKDLYDGVSVVMLTEQDTPQALRESFRAGASGFLTKDCSAAEVVGYARRASHGEYVVSRRATEVLISSFVHDAKVNAARDLLARRADELPPRLHEVYERVVAGEQNYRIAKLLGLTENTVRIYVSDILRRLGYGARTELIAASAGNDMKME